VNEPRRGEHIVNTHTGETKPDDEAFDPNKHGSRCYHQADVADAIDHWGSYNGRAADKQTVIDIVSAMDEMRGPVQEVFHLDQYVAVLFADGTGSVGCYVNTGFLTTVEKASESQFVDDGGLWRHQFDGFSGGGSSTGSTAADPIVDHALCPDCFVSAPVGTNCALCERPITAD